MLFNSYTFLFLFLPLVVAGYWLLIRSGLSRASLIWLVAASLFYYGWWEIKYLGLIVLSVALNFALGRLLEHYSRSKPLLVIGVALNLGALAWFKYAGFLAVNFGQLTGTEIHLKTIILPLGISFFTFQQIAYLVDIHRGQTAVTDPVSYSLFVTFFPQLIAGPIVQQQEMLPQFAGEQGPSRFSRHLAVGGSIFLLGLFKKVVLADGVAAYASPVFEAADQGADITLFEAWGGALAYTYQIYFDFSGYSDMAVGLARLFGFRLPVNFNSPYQATGIIDFWRRWHMTLSRFLKYYLYIPLGGNRTGKARLYFNLMLTMVLGGLWHGAGWNFVIWGAIHGVFLVINVIWRRGRRNWTDRPAGRLETLAGWALTFTLVVLARVFFRAGSFSGAVALLKGASGLNGAVLDERLAGSLSFLQPWVQFSGTHAGYFNLYGVPWLVGLSLVCWFMPNVQMMFAEARAALDPRGGLWKTSAGAMLTWRPGLVWAAAVALLGVLAVTHMSRVMEFVYYQF